MSIDFNMSSTDEEIQIPEEDILDVDLLITSVEERPLLWDKTLDSYSDRNEKRKCWRDIFSIMKPGFEELDIKDQKIIGKIKKIAFCVFFNYVLLGVVIFKISIIKYYTDILNENTE
jgi:hypothetical protein